MKDEDLKLDEIEASLTLGGSGEVTRVEGRGEGGDATLLSYTHRIHHSHATEDLKHSQRFHPVFYSFSMH